MKKLISFLLVTVLVFGSSLIVFAADSYTYVCTKCGETVEVIAGVDMHHMFCDGEGNYCNICGEIIYGSDIDFSIHRIACESMEYYRSIDLRIENNPGETTLNYGDTLRLRAIPYSDGERVEDELTEENYVWKVDNGSVQLTSYGEYCEIEAVKSGKVTVTVYIVDEDGEAVYIKLEDGETLGLIDTQTINVKAGFFQKLISFFKDLFGINRTIVQ